MPFSKESMQILKEFIGRNSLQSIEHSSLGKTLYQTQVAAVVYSLLFERVMVSADTGLGKTDVAIAMINLVLSTDEKAIVVVKRNTMGDILEKLCDSLRNELKIGYLTDQGSVVEKMITKNGINHCNVVLISSDSLLNDEVCRYLYRSRESITCVIIDEMHLFSNLESVESRFMEKLLETSKYALQLTATPFERDPQQVLNSIWMLDHNAFGGMSAATFANRFKVYLNGEFSHYENLDVMKKYIQKYIFSVTRGDLGIEPEYRVTERRVSVDRNMKELRGLEAVKAIKAVKGNAYYKLVQLINDYTARGLKGLIYINLNKTKEFIYDSLREQGFKVGINDGSVCRERHIDRGQVREAFRNGELDVLITNIVVSLDLSCDYIIYYELTQSYKQMTGRGIRNYEQGELIVDIIYGKDSYEEEFFKSNVYDRVSMLSQLCGKSMSGLSERRVE